MSESKGADDLELKEVDHTSVTISPETEPAGKGPGSGKRVTNEPPVKLTKKELTLVMAGIMTGVFLAALDQTIVSTALPKIVSDFGRLDLYSWVIVAYLLTSTSIIPLCGKFSDIFGRKILFQLAMIVFLAGSILCGVSTSMDMLIVFRAIQGLGGGAIMALSQIILGDVVSVQDRGKYGGLFGGVFALASVLGPVLGGVITTGLTWNWVFYVNIPFAIVAFIIVQVGLKLPMPKTGKTKMETIQSIDWVGIVTIMTGIVLVLLGITLGGSQYPWDSWQTILLLVLGGLLLVSFVVNELFFTKNPIIPIRSFLHNKDLALLNIVALLIGYGMFGGLSYMPIYFQNVIGDSPTNSGLKLIPLMVGLVGASMVSGVIISKKGYYYPFLMIGCGLAALGYGLLYLLEWNWPYKNLVGILFVIGMGVGSLIQTLVIAVQFFSERHEIAIMTSTVTFMRTMGGVIGVAVMGVMLDELIPEKLPPNLSGPARGGYHAIMSLPSEEDRTEVFVQYTNVLRILFVSVVPIVGIGGLLGFLVANKRITRAQGSEPVVPME